MCENNYFECSKKKNMLFLWGKYIKSVSINIDEKIEQEMSKFSIPFDEVIEINEEEAYSFVLTIINRNNITFEDEIKKFIFITTEGFTYQPDSISIEPDIENCQVIGFSSGLTANIAFQNLIQENKYLKDTSFNTVICYQLNNNYKQNRKYFTI